MSARAKALSRRHFLWTLGAGSVAAGAAIATGKAPPSLPADKSQRDPSRYHATEHVNHYYRTTRV